MRRRNISVYASSRCASTDLTVLIDDTLVYSVTLLKDGVMARFLGTKSNFEILFLANDPLDAVDQQILDFFNN